MSAQVWNGPIDKVVVPAGAAGQVTPSFSSPDNAYGVMIFVPALSANVNLKVQALQPKDGDQDADSYADLSTALTGGASITASTVSGLGGTTAIAYGMDAGVLGAGVFRLVTTGIGSQATPVTVTIAWRVGRNRH